MTRAPDGTHEVIDSTGRWVLFATICASSMGFIAQAALNPALPAIQDALGASGVDLLWIVNAYQLMLGALILVGGSLGDHYGRKRVYLIGIVIFTLGSVLCGLAPGTRTLIAARLVQGLGGALMIPGSLALISAYFDGRARSQAIGIWSSFTTMTSVAGPILGGWLADADLWRGVFFVNVPLAAASLYALLVYVPESKDDDSPKGLDYSGAVLVTLGLAGIVYGFTSLGRLGIADGLQSPRILAALILGVLALIAFIYVEAHSPHPLMSLRLFKSRSFTGANLLTLLLYGALGGSLFLLPLMLIQVQSYSATAAGFASLPISIMLVLMSPWAGGLIDKTGPRRPLVAGPIIVGFGFIGLSLPGLAESSDTVLGVMPLSYFTSYFPGMLVFGLGMGLTVAPLTSTVMGSVARHNAGVASGINNAVSRASGVLAVAIMGGIALILFSSSLMSSVDALDLPEAARISLEAEAENLAEAAIPSSLNPEQTRAVQQAIDTSFLDTFQILMRIGAVMAFISAGLAFWFIEDRLRNPDA